MLDFDGNDRFQIIRQLGEGGMGVVYEVDDRHRGQRIALKTLKHSDADTLYRLKREFRSLADLSHPNLCDLYDLVVEGHACFLTMELVEGTNFVDYCRAQASEARLRAALRQLAEGVHALHQAGMVHRDLKPSNVIVTPEGRVVVLDFGLVADVTRSDSLAGRIIGTVEYMAPEQAAGDPPTAAIDWYGVGVLLYEVLTGQVPFSGPLMEVLLQKQQRPATPPRALVTAVPEDLDALCVDLLARSPAQRPSGEQILARLGVTRPSPVPRGTMTSALQRLVFAGRDEELGLLERAFARVRGGEANAVVVRGESGMGKSALVRQFVDRKRRADGRVVVLEGRCYERESVPYKAMDGLVDQLASYWLQLPPDQAAALLPRRGALLRRLFPSLGRVPAIAELSSGAPIHDPQELRSQAFGALREVFERLGERCTLILQLDDLQWVDPDSVALLSDLMRPPDPPRLLLLLSARTASDATDLDRLLRDLEIQLGSIDLAPLGRAAATEAARGLLHGEARSFADRVAVESHGIPVFIEELALYLQIGDTAGDAPVSLDEVVDRRLARLPEPARELLELTAAAGEPISPQVASTALAHSAEDISRELRYLRTALLVRAPGGSASDRVEPYHDRLRSAVMSQVTPGRMRDLHRRLALALEQIGEGGSERLARHWHLAGEPHRAAELARAAGDEAAATVDFDRAARLYQLALSLSDLEPAGERALRISLAEALANAGRAPEAARAFLAAAERTDSATRLELRSRAAGELLRGGHFGDGMTLLREVLAEIGLRLSRSQRSALASALVGRALLRIRGLGFKSRDESELSHKQLIELDVVNSVAISFANVDTFRAFEFATRHVLLSLRAGEPSRLAAALGVDAGFMAVQGKRRRAVRLVELAEQQYRLARDRGIPTMPFHGWARGAISYFIDNDWAEAVRHFKQTEDEIRRTYQSRGWGMDMAQLYGSFARYYRGEWGELARSIPRLIREAERRGDLYASMCYRSRLNVIYLMRDRAELAERALLDAQGSWPTAEELGFQVQHYWVLVGRCELDLYRGQPERAWRRLEDARGALARSALRRVVQVDVECWYLESRILAAMAVADEAGRPALLRRLERPHRALARHRTPLGRGFTLLAGAAAANLRGNAQEAAELLLEATRSLDRSHTLAHATAARRRLGELRGDHELVDQADGWMTGQRIRNPARMAHMLVAGFPMADD